MTGGGGGGGGGLQHFFRSAIYVESRASSNWGIGGGGGGGIRHLFLCVVLGFKRGAFIEKNSQKGGGGGGDSDTLFSGAPSTSRVAQIATRE